MDWILSGEKIFSVVSLELSEAADWRDTKRLAQKNICADSSGVSIALDDKQVIS
jgi:hypothetical protein